MKKNGSVTTWQWDSGEDPYPEARPSLFWALMTGLLFWVGLIGILLCMGIATVQAQDSTPSLASDPMVMKIYPDGTKIIVRWSEIGKAVDNGEKFGGAPRIVAYDPAKDGVVPIGEPSKQPQTASTNAVPSVSTNSVVTPEQPAKMDYTHSDPATPDEQLGPMEGFCFRTAVGPSFQQPISGRSGSGNTYYKNVFQPGIRFDLEPGYHITEWFRMGAETAFIYNQTHSFSVGGRTDYGSGDPGGLYQIPILASATFTFPTEGPIRGYFGGGAGGAWSVLQANNNLQAQNGQPGFTNYTWSFAWQVTAGLKYTISPGFDLEFAYKCLSTPVFNLENAGQIKPLFNHTAEIGLAWRF